MRLLLMRHGEASWQASSDAERPLTDQGVAQTQQVISMRIDALRQADTLWVSPYLRAQQTAQLVRTEVPKLVPNILDVLTPEGDLTDLLAALADCQSETLLVVSHNPLVSRLVNLLLGTKGRYQLGTSALVALDFDVAAAGCAELVWVELGY